MQIEIINHKKTKILAAMIDWDGAISLIREGWQRIMQEYIANFISSGLPQKNDYLWAQSFIKKTLGENTVEQMLGMIEKAEQNGRNDIPVSYSEKMALAEEHRKKYREILEKEVRGKRIKTAKKNPDKFIVRGMKYLLEELKKRNIKIFVASGSEQEGKGGIEEEAETLGLKHYFEAVFGYNGSISPYNKENVVKWILNKYNLDPLQLLVVGDGPKEMKVGKKFGAVTIGLISNNVTRKILLDSGADFIVYNAIDLSECLKQIVF